MRSSPAEAHRTWIRRHFTETGGILASATYQPYQRVWLRDHALVAQALLRWNFWPEVKQAAAFSARILQAEAPRMERAIQHSPQDPHALDEALHPRARYWPDGSWVQEPWAERQYDGVALNLWFLAEVAQRTGRWPVPLEVVEITARYLLHFWPTPCAGPWEMYETAVHTWTLGAVYRALNAVVPVVPEARQAAQQIRGFLEAHLTPQGLPRKMILHGQPVGWDASSLMLFLDFQVWPAQRAAPLLPLLDAWLSPDGIQLRRFVIPELGIRDTYFGGGVWVIPSVWAARIALHQGNPERAQRLLALLPPPSDPLPEQWPETAWDPAGRFWWHWKSLRENRGSPGPARPLAWSHAAVLNLLKDLEDHSS